MKRSLKYVMTLITLALLTTSLSAGQILNGVPGGDFDTDFATNKPDQDYPGQGTWTYYQHTNGHADIVTDGDERYLQLWSGWDWNGLTTVTFTAETPTPTDSPWLITADMCRKAAAYNGDNKRLFALRYNTVVIMSLDFGQSTVDGYKIRWTAGDQSGTFLSATSIFDIFRTVAFSYDPLTGQAQAKCGSETVFDTTINKELRVNNLYFESRMYGANSGGYDNSRVAIDNIQGFTPLMPLVNDHTGTLYTNADGIGSTQIVFTEPAVFSQSDVIATDSADNPVALTVAGSGTDTMTINFTAPLEYDTYTVNLQDTIVSLADGTPIYTGIESIPSGSLPNILGGIPGGDFSRDTLAAAYGEGNFWSYHTTTNAFVTLEPDGGTPTPSNYVRLRTEWYDRTANMWYVNSAATPLNYPWGVAADVMNIPGGYEGNERVFGLRTQTTLGEFSDYAFSMDFNYLNDEIYWVAGTLTGTTSFPAGLSKDWTTAVIEYNPGTGNAVGKFGDTVVFDVTTETNLSADTVFFSNRDRVTPQDTGSFNIDNITSYVVEEPQPEMNVFELQHRRQMDMNNDNAVDLVDYAKFASDWMN